MSEPFHRTETGIAVDLPKPIRLWVAENAAAAATDAVVLGNPVHRRLLGPIDPTSDHDDPLTELQRQFAVEGSLGVLVKTADARELSEDEAEEWIRGLQLILAATAARLSIFDEDDVADLDESDGQTVMTIQALISLMIDALDS